MSDDTALFGEITTQLDENVEELFQQPFFLRLSDERIPIRRSMTFIPYWTYFAIGFADACDTWFAIENPQNELEERINVYVGEDSFYYNFFLNDVETVLGYRYIRILRCSHAARMGRRHAPSQGVHLRLVGLRQSLPRIQ